MKLYVKIFKDLFPMFIVQFFTWLALFALWIYATPFFAQAIFHSGDAAADFESGITWAGYAFAFYVSLAAIFSFYITKFSKKIGAAKFHAACLLAGSGGLGSLFFLHEKFIVFLSFLFIAVAWSSISNVPYTLVEKVAEVEDSEDEERLNSYFKVFNLSVVLPQISAAFFWNYVNKNFFAGDARYVLLSGAGSMFVAAITMLVFSPALDKIKPPEELSEL